MARTPGVKILEWGTPPEAEPTGWEAVAKQLDGKPGSWANVGEMSPATARKISAERLPEAAGYEVRAVPTKDDRKVAVWVRRVAADAVETTEALPESDDAVKARVAAKRAARAAPPTTPADAA